MRRAWAIVFAIGCGGTAVQAPPSRPVEPAHTTEPPTAVEQTEPARSHEPLFSSQPDPNATYDYSAWADGRAVAVSRPCDADELASSGQHSYEIGQFGVALKKFEQAVRCRGDASDIDRAFMAACQAMSLPTAQYYWRRMSNVAKDRDVQICARAGYRREDLDR